MDGRKETSYPLWRRILLIVIVVLAIIIGIYARQDVQGLGSSDNKQETSLNGRVGIHGYSNYQG